MEFKHQKKEMSQTNNLHSRISPDSMRGRGAFPIKWEGRAIAITRHCWIFCEKKHGRHQGHGKTQEKCILLVLFWFPSKYRVYAMIIENASPKMAIINSNFNYNIQSL
jgi:hypothetical protein